MLIVLVSWFYIFITLLNFGYLGRLFFKNSFAVNKLIHLVLGLITLMFIGHIWAFFSGFNANFHFFLLFVNLLISLIYRKEIIIYIKDILKAVIKIKLKSKILLLVIFFLVLAKSASLGSRLDNENYYIQSIQWLNEYGFFKGLGNLHLYFCQTSGWHVLQSIFSFDFTDFAFNDLGSFMLLLFNIYAIITYQSKYGSSLLLIGLPVLNFILLEFTIVPSPDFGIIMIFLVVVHLFLKNFAQPDSNTFYLIFLLSLSAMLIKVTGIGLFVFPIILLYKIRNKSLRFWLKLLSTSLIFVSIWIGKNLIISGYPFFPSDYFSEYFNIKHQVPKELFDFSLRKDMLYEFFATPEEVNNLSYFELFWKWLTRSKVSFIFNVSLILYVLIIPLWIIRFKNKPAYWYIYLSFIGQLIFLAITSPQYRFAIQYLFIFSLMIFIFHIGKKTKFLLFSFSQLIVLYFILYPLRYDKISSTNFHLNPSVFRVQNLIYPAPNSSISSKYEIINMGNLKYYTPVKNVYFWSNGDCKLPCLNDRQLHYFKHYFNYIPQLIDNDNLSKGLYSKKLNKKNIK